MNMLKCVSAMEMYSNCLHNKDIKLFYFLNNEMLFEIILYVLFHETAMTVATTLPYPSPRPRHSI